MEEVLAYTRHNFSTSSSTSVASSSRVRLPTNGASNASGGSTAYAARQALDARLDSLDAEIASVDAEAAKLKQLRARLVADKAEVMRQIEHARSGRNTAAESSKGKAKGVNYNDDYEWTPDLKARMQRVFGIKDFRLCQQGCVPRILPIGQL